VRILVADDDAVNRRMLQASLERWNYEVILAGDGGEAWNILQREDTPKLAILDWMMPGMDGLEICREVRKRHDQFYTYIILLTANTRKEDILVGLEAGADDYLTKPFERNELKARLRTGRRILELQERLLAATDALQNQLAHDPLTGMLSRTAILETLRIELIRSQREQTTVGILMADVDHFKQVNDTYGHLAGDTVLREVAKRMYSSARPYDTVGRYGGEEFLIVLPGCNISGALSSAERLRNAIGKAPVDAPEGIIPVTLSLGATVGGGAIPAELEELLRTADAALYEAKKSGRNQVAVSTPSQALLANPAPKPKPPGNVVGRRAT